MSWVLTIFVAILTLSHLSEASHHKRKLPSAVVVGTVYCDTCFQENLDKTSHFISGASVAVECKYGSNPKPIFQQEVKTDNHGEFKVHLPFAVSKHVEKIEGCSVKLISSSEPYCAVASTATSSSLHLKARKEGTHIFSAGFFSFKPQKQPTLCNQKPSIQTSKDLSSKKAFLHSNPDFTFPPPLQDLPAPGLVPALVPPGLVPGLPNLPPNLPPLPQLPPLPPLPGIPKFPPTFPGKPTAETQKPSIQSSKDLSSKKAFLHSNPGLVPGLVPPGLVPGLPNLPPNLPPLPQLPPLPPLPGIPNFPPTFPGKPIAETQKPSIQSSKDLSSKKAFLHSNPGLVPGLVPPGLVPGLPNLPPNLPPLPQLPPLPPLPGIPNFPPTFPGKPIAETQKPSIQSSKDLSSKKAFLHSNPGLVPGLVPPGLVPGLVPPGLVPGLPNLPPNLPPLPQLPPLPPLPGIPNFPPTFPGKPIAETQKPSIQSSKDLSSKKAFLHSNPGLVPPGLVPGLVPPGLVPGLPNLPPNLPPLPQLPPLPPLPGIPNFPPTFPGKQTAETQKPSIQNSKDLSSKKAFLHSNPDFTFPPPLQDPPAPGLVPGLPNLPISPQLPPLPPLPGGLPNLPPLPQLPPLPPLPGIPNFPPTFPGKQTAETQTTQSPTTTPNTYQKEVRRDAIFPPFFPPLIPNPFQPPPLIPNPFQPPASPLIPNPFQPPPAPIIPNPFQPPPAPIIPNPFQPTPAAPSPIFSFPPIPGLTPSPPPPPPTFHFPTFPFPPLFPPSPPRTSPKQSSTSP